MVVTCLANGGTLSHLIWRRGLLSCLPSLISGSQPVLVVHKGLERVVPINTLAITDDDRLLFGIQVRSAWYMR